jgi:hypothetical protein
MQTTTPSQHAIAGVGVGGGGREPHGCFCAALGKGKGGRITPQLTHQRCRCCPCACAPPSAQLRGRRGRTRWPAEGTRAQGPGAAQALPGLIAPARKGMHVHITVHAGQVQGNGQGARGTQPVPSWSFGNLGRTPAPPPPPKNTHTTKHNNKHTHTHKHTPPHLRDVHCDDLQTVPHQALHDSLANASSGTGHHRQPWTGTPAAVGGVAAAPGVQGLPGHKRRIHRLQEGGGGNRGPGRRAGLLHHQVHGNAAAAQLLGQAGHKAVQARGEQGRRRRRRRRWGPSRARRSAHHSDATAGSHTLDRPPGLWARGTCARPRGGVTAPGRVLPVSSCRKC